MDELEDYDYESSMYSLQDYQEGLEEDLRELEEEEGEFSPVVDKDLEYKATKKVANIQTFVSRVTHLRCAATTDEAFLAEHDRYVQKKSWRNWKFDPDLYQDAMIAVLSARDQAEGAIQPDRYVHTVAVNAITKSMSDWMEIPKSSLNNKKHGTASEATAQAITHRLAIGPIPEGFEGSATDAGALSPITFLGLLPQDQAEILR